MFNDLGIEKFDAYFDDVFGLFIKKFDISLYRSNSTLFFFIFQHMDSGATEPSFIESCNHFYEYGDVRVRGGWVRESETQRKILTGIFYETKYKNR